MKRYQIELITRPAHLADDDPFVWLHAGEHAELETAQRHARKAFNDEIDAVCVRVLDQDNEDAEVYYYEG